ncbi:MAG: hypothetical protein EOP11_12125 [Proteobacteria bacterium]|nr:MAG: hypothetical protein EOP11_12125 [Pseudomonadota bacterium]
MRKVVLLETRNFLESYSCEDRDILDAEKRALWKAFSIYGIVPPHDLFDRLKENYAIELYSLDGRQIWRNLACLELCSYTLEEIACLSVFDRYERPTFIERKCINEVEALLCERRADIFDPNIMIHTAKEVSSEFHFTLSLKHDLFASLRGRNGELKAWLAMTLGELVNEGSAPAEVGNVDDR